MAAVLFKIEAAVRKGYTTIACTEEPCKWNQCFLKQVSPATIADIQFYKDEVKQKYAHNIEHMPMNSASQEEQVNFLKSLAQCTKPPFGISSFAGFCKPFESTGNSSVMHTLPLEMRSLFSQSTSLSHSEHMNKIRTNEKEVAYMETQTQAQSLSPLWHKM